MRAVKDTAARLFASTPARTVPAADAVRRYVTVIVDAVARSATGSQSPAWRAGVKIAALDPAAPYRSALTDPEVGLHNAQLVLDHFHVQKLANAAIDDVRRRVQQETTGHRGRKPDPLYRSRRTGRRGPLRGGRLHPHGQGAAQVRVRGA
jgi:transposase